MLREAKVRLSQGEKTGAICRSFGISEQRCYRRRREYGGLKVTQAARLKALEKENVRLRKAVSSLTLDLGDHNRQHSDLSGGPPDGAGHDEGTDNAGANMQAYIDWELELVAQRANDGVANVNIVR